MIAAMETLFETVDVVRSSNRMDDVAAGFSDKPLMLGKGPSVQIGQAISDISPPTSRFSRLAAVSRQCVRT